LTSRPPSLFVLPPGCNNRVEEPCALHESESNGSLASTGMKIISCDVATTAKFLIPSAPIAIVPGEAWTFSLRSVEIARHGGHVRMRDDPPSASTGKLNLHLSRFFFFFSSLLLRFYRDFISRFEARTRREMIVSPSFRRQIGKCLKVSVFPSRRNKLNGLGGNKAFEHSIFTLTFSCSRCCSYAHRAVT